MEQEQISDSVIRKIQLLFNLAEQSRGNENEAAAAMGKAQELLAKYNLDLATVQDKVVEGGTAQAKAEGKRDYRVVNRSAMYEWQRRLVNEIATANFCWHFTTTVYEPYNTRLGEKTRKVKRHKILGREGNTMVVLMMVDYLMETLERLLPYPNTERLSKSAISWREGCVDRLIHRIREKAEEMKTPDYAKQGEEGYSTALAIRNVVEAEEIGNYDACYGAGAWARSQAANAKWAAEHEERSALRTKEQQEERDAQRLLLANETPTQKARREKQEAAEQAKQAAADRRAYEKYYREQERRANRLDHSAYREGHKVGDEINLDSQIAAGKVKGSL